MGLTGVLAQIATQVCPRCKTDYGKHSKKNFMKCLYSANYELYQIMLQINEMKEETSKAVEKYDGGGDDSKKEE